MSQTIKLKEIQRHNFLRSVTNCVIYPTSFADNEIVELKKWKLEEILDPNGPFHDHDKVRKRDGKWTPLYDLMHAGFVYEGQIDLKILFGDYSEKDLDYAGEAWGEGGFERWVGRPAKLCKDYGMRDLRQIKDKLEASLNKVDYKNRELILYRTCFGQTSFSGGWWDNIIILSEKKGEPRRCRLKKCEVCHDKNN